MSDTERQGSIYGEMAERRSRSEELQSKAEEMGVPVFVPDSVSESASEVEENYEIVSEVEISEVNDSVSDPELEEVAVDALQDEQELPEPQTIENEMVPETDLVVPADPDPVIEDIVEPASDAELELEVNSIGEETSYFSDLDEELPKEQSSELLEATEEVEQVSAISEELGVSEEIATAEVADDSVEELDLPAAEEPESVADEEVASFEVDAEPLEVESKAPEAIDSDPVEEETVSANDDIQEEAEAPAVDEIEAIGDPEPVSEEAISEDIPDEISDEEPKTPEQLIGESVDLLGDAPEMIEDSDVRRVAEDIVDKIGSVVDIHNLPKTQPSRVLSKVAKAQEAEKGGSEEKVELPVVEKKTEAKAETSSVPPKKKRKKVSLLDSYFKGL
ncbi:hypothetical protein [Pelagicoccus albus]|uniref:Uncharacterized protein n=1 Tax=Pelagicoccus albus TaxID=415222 RepID=A0A7X1B688_9BACT|nr:hypothetical protein [Pelagicoccus albus]MBC2605278.1 hypothetical protein [Pelagicoccus albus]